MTDQEHFLQMLIHAEVSFTERTTRGERPLIDVDGGNGALAVFAFSNDGRLVGFAIDKNAY